MKGFVSSHMEWSFQQRVIDWQMAFCVCVGFKWIIRWVRRKEVSVRSSISNDCTWRVNSKFLSQIITSDSLVQICFAWYSTSKCWFVTCFIPDRVQVSIQTFFSRIFPWRLCVLLGTHPKCSRNKFSLKKFPRHVASKSAHCKFHQARRQFGQEINTCLAPFRDWMASVTRLVVALHAPK